MLQIIMTSLQRSSIDLYTYWWIMIICTFTVQSSSVQSFSHVRLFATPSITASQASLSITNSWSSPKLMCIESVMPSSHLILCRPLLLLPPIPPSIRVFSNESTLHMRWPKYLSFSFSISPSNEHPGLVSFRIEGSNRTIQKSKINIWSRGNSKPKSPDTWIRSASSRNSRKTV